MSVSYGWDDVTWLIYDSYTWLICVSQRESRYVTCALRRCGTLSHSWLIWVSFVTHMTHMCESRYVTCALRRCSTLSHSHKWHIISHIYMSHVVTWLVYMCNVRISHFTYKWGMCGWGVSRNYEACHVCEWVMSHVWMSHVARMNGSCPTYEWVMSHMWMSHVTHMNESCRTYE